MIFYFSSTEAELDFVSGVSEAEVTDTEFFKPVSGSVSAPRLSNGKESVTTLEEKNSQQEKYSAIGKAPKFEMFPPDKILLVEGGSIRLDCVISGIPTPLVTWSKNDAILKTGYRCKIIEDKEKSKIWLSLLINCYTDALHDLTNNNLKVNSFFIKPFLIFYFSLIQSSEFK